MKIFRWAKSLKQFSNSARWTGGENSELVQSIYVCRDLEIHIKLKAVWLRLAANLSRFGFRKLGSEKGRREKRGGGGRGWGGGVYTVFWYSCDSLQEYGWLAHLVFWIFGLVGWFGWMVVSRVGWRFGELVVCLDGCTVSWLFFFVVWLFDWLIFLLVAGL